MASKAGFTFLDASGENGRVDVYMATADNTHVDADVAELNPVTAGSVAYTMQALSLCTMVGSNLEAVNNKYTETPPASLLAQRELGLLVTYQDTVTQAKYRLTIPGPDWANIGQAGTDNVDPADAAWLAFVTAFEAHCLSPVGNAVSVLSGRLVGRNR